MLRAKMTGFETRPYFPAMLVGLVAVLFGCDGPPKTAPAEIHVETKVFGMAALNTSGARVEARSFSDDALIGSPTTTDETGHYQLRLKSFSGDLVVRVCGGSYTDMATGTHTDVGDDCLHALAIEMRVCESRQVNVSPFSEFTHSYSRARGLEGAKALEEHMEGWMGETDAATRSAVFAGPEAFEGGEGVELSPRSMSYLMLGGFSRLARELSERAGLQPGLRLSTMRLAKLISEDISDGSIDGATRGRRLMISDTQPLPPSLLRQEFAQAIRSFADSDKNQSRLTSESVLDALSSISLGHLPALGPEGEELDREAPSVTITGIVDNGVVAADATISCLARDTTGVRQVWMEVRFCQSDELLHRHHVYAEGRDQTEQSLSIDFGVSGRISGQYSAVCRADDVWGNAQERQVLFSINQGNILPSIALEPPLLDPLATVSGNRTVRCTFDDPYVTSISGHIDGPTERIELPIVNSVNASTYEWDSTRDMDGIHTLSCHAWTFGHPEPRTSSTTVTVKNHDKGLLTGRLFLGAPLRDMQMSAFKWDHHGRGALIGGPSPIVTEDGRFEVSISNEYRGAILLEARLRPSRERPVMDSMIFGGHTQELSRDLALSLLLPRYEPGDRLETLSVNVATTLASELAYGNVQRAPWLPLEDEINTSSFLLGRHISPLAPLDISCTQVPDMTQRVAGVGEARTALGLFHAGLSVMAAEECVRGHDNRDGSTIADMLSCLSNDIRSGQLDGRDSTGEIARTLFSISAPNMLRSRLARAVYLWLQKTDGTDQMCNRTGLTSDAAIESGWLEQISTSDLRLFGGHPGTPFDTDGPNLRIECRNDRGQDVSCADIFKEVVFIRVIADDVVGVESTEVFHRGAQIQSRMGGTPEIGEYAIQVEEGHLGASPVIVRSRDRLGNQSEQELRLFFDRRPVEINGLQREYLSHGVGYFGVPFTTSRDIVRFSVSGEKLDRQNAVVPERIYYVDPMAEFVIPLNLQPGGGVYRYSLRVEDRLGNVGHKNFYVVLNNNSIEVSMAPADVHDRERDDLRPIVFGEPTRITLYDVDLDPYHWAKGRSSGMVWSAQVSRDGVLQDGFDDEPIEGRYRFIMSDRGVRKVGGWRVLEKSDGEGHPFVVEVNYETMLSSITNLEKEALSSDDNVIFYASTDAQYTMELEFEDAYDHKITKRWEFQITLVTPPVNIWIDREYPQENEDWRSFSRNSTALGGVSDLTFNAFWFNGELNNGEERASARSMLPRLPDVRISMDDIPQQWTVFAPPSHAIDTSLVQFANFANDMEYVLVRRGSQSLRLETRGVWDNPEWAELSFIDRIRQDNAEAFRVFWEPNYQPLVSEDEWRSNRGTNHERWNWEVRIAPSYAGQILPVVQPDPYRVKYGYTLRFESNPGMYSGWWIGGLFRVDGSDLRRRSPCRM